MLNYSRITPALLEYVSHQLVSKSSAEYWCYPQFTNGETKMEMHFLTARSACKLVAELGRQARSIEPQFIRLCSQQKELLFLYLSRLKCRKSPWVLWIIKNRREMVDGIIWEPTFI